MVKPLWKLQSRERGGWYTEGWWPLDMLVEAVRHAMRLRQFEGLRCRIVVEDGTE